MANAYVGGAAVDTGASSVTSKAISYSPAAGNTVVLFLAPSVPISSVSCVDNLGNALTLGPLMGGFGPSAYYYRVPSGVTSYTFSWTTAAVAGIVIAEYSGVMGVTARSTDKAGITTSNAPSITIADITALDWIVCGLYNSSSQALTGTTGNARQQTAASTERVVLMDNTSGAIGNITCSASMGSSVAWGAAGILLEGPLTCQGPTGWGAACPGTEIVQPRGDTLLTTASWDSIFDAQLVYQAGSTIGLTFAPVWGSFSLDDGWVGLAYDEEWALEYCATPCTFSLVSGSLPTGLTLSSFGSASGKISGTPTTAGSYSFTLRATNAFGSADKAFSITINTPPASGGGGAWTFFG